MIKSNIFIILSSLFLSGYSKSSDSPQLSLHRVPNFSYSHDSFDRTRLPMMYTLLDSLDNDDMGNIESVETFNKETQTTTHKEFRSISTQTLDQKTPKASLCELILQLCCCTWC